MTTEIFSIFGQIEEVAATILLEEPNSPCRRIDAREIPETAMFNDLGQTAKFAIMMPRGTVRRGTVRRFEELIADLRA